MGLVVIPDKHISYQCLSSDISGSKISNATYIGASLYVSDWDRWFRVLEDLTLSPLNYYNRDKVAEATVVIESDHHEAHKGNSFSATRVATLGNGGKVSVLIRTSTTPQKYSHLLIHFRGSQESNYVFYENPTVTGSGTIIPIFCRNRQLANTAETLISGSPSISGSGTAIYEEHFGGNGGEGGEARGNLNGF